jgi:hypothetical protein
MTVEYVTLPSGKPEWHRLKCFYNQDGKYAEFIINVNPSKHLIQFEAKCPHYEPVLIEAFTKTLSEF